jgi:ADP-ribose pyrophosphatase YjhB (NUDIX family)
MIQLLPYEEHTHNSVKIVIPEKSDTTNDDNNNINPDVPASSPQSFHTRLLATIAACKQLHKSALWISVPMSQTSIIEQHMTSIPNLQFHHASGNTVHLALWLNDDIENKIPEYATHQIGVGAVVINSNNQILCVKEMRNNYRPWKIPGGLAELGEQLDAAAVREVLEETGVNCTFTSVLSFRHTHGLQFGRSDIYFVCRLQPVEEVDELTGEVQIPEPVAQECEIADVCWLPFQEYREMVGGEKPHPMMQKVLEVLDSENGSADIDRSVISSIVPGRKPSPIYHSSIINKES